MQVINPEQVRLIEYEERYGPDTVRMWRDSKERALGVKESYSFAEHLEFLQEVLVRENSTFLAIPESGEEVLGFMATDGIFLNQLYIHVDFQYIGIGSRLLQLAKELSPGALKLYTFEINTGARAFYEKHGFKILARGCDNEEQLQDILYEWRKHD